MTISCLGVIPARLESSRLPGKPLKDIEGRSLVQRVWEQASKASRLAHLVVATDDRSIADHVRGFGAEAIMTGSHHATGSDRVAETAQIVAAQGKSFDLVANIQGDMPFINPKVIDLTIDSLAQSSPEFGISTVSTPILSEEEFQRPASVKVVLGYDNLALYFSRSPVPFWRERGESQITETNPYGFKHVGLYVFRPDVLQRLSSLAPSLPEIRERLEQLRALSHGIKIKVAVAPSELMTPSIEVDTPEDLERACAAARTSLGL